MKFNKKGFTIVELVIVIAVIAILAAVLIPTFSSVTKSAKQSAALQQAKSGLDSVIALTGGVLPDGTLFSVSDNEDGKVSYNFEYKNNSLQTNTAIDAAPETAGTNPTTNKNYYAIYVSAKCFDRADADLTSQAYLDSDEHKEVLAAKAKTEALILSVLKSSTYTTATAAAIGTKVPGQDYYTMTVTNDPALDVEFRIYYNGDINETLVVFVGK